MFSSFLKGLTSIFVSDEAAVYTDHQFTDWADRIWVVELNSEKVCSQDLLFNLFAEYLNQFGYVSLRYSLSLVSQGRPGTPAQGRMLQSAVGLSKTKIRIFQVRFSDEHQTQLEYFEPLFFGFGSKLASWKFIATQPAPGTIPLVSSKVADGLALLMTENCTYNKSNRTYTARLEDSVKFSQLVRALEGHFTSSGLKKGKVTSSSIELLNEGKPSGVRLTLGTNSSKQSVLRATWDEHFLPSGGTVKFFRRCDKVLAHNLFLAGSPPLRTPPPYMKKKSNPSLAELAQQGTLKEGQKLDHRVAFDDEEKVYTATFKKKGEEYEVVDDVTGKSFASVSAWTAFLRTRATKEKRVSLKQFLQEEKAKDAKNKKEGNAEAGKNGKDGKDGNEGKDEKKPVKEDGDDKPKEVDEKPKNGSGSKHSSDKPATSSKGAKPKARAIAIAKPDPILSPEDEPKKLEEEEAGAEVVAKEKDSSATKSGKPKGSKSDSLLERENKVLARNKKKRPQRKKPTQDGGPVATAGKPEEKKEGEEKKEEKEMKQEKEKNEEKKKPKKTDADKKEEAKALPALPAEEKPEKKADKPAEASNDKKKSSSSSEPALEEPTPTLASPEPAKLETTHSSSSSEDQKPVPPKPAEKKQEAKAKPKSKSSSSSSSSDPIPEDPKPEEKETKPEPKKSQSSSSKDEKEEEAAGKDESSDEAFDEVSLEEEKN